MASPLPIIPGRLPAAPESYDRDNEAMTRRIIELALARGPTANDGDSGTVPESDGTMIEAIDRHGGGSGAGISVFPAGTIRSSATGGIFFTNGTHPFVVEGSGVWRKSTVSGAQCLIPEWPLYSNWEDLGFTVDLVTPLRYIWSVLFMAHDAGAEIGLRSQPNGIETDTDILGYVLIDDAGFWTLHRRLTDAGSLEALDVAFTVTFDEPHRLQVLYDEGTTPTLTFIIDGVVWYQTSGVANMPDLPPGGVNEHYGPSVYGNILTLDNRINIEEL